MKATMYIYLINEASWKYVPRVDILKDTKQVAYNKTLQKCWFHN